jgi:abequosyltransferase
VRPQHDRRIPQAVVTKARQQSAWTSQVTLSFCMPTYNYGRYIGAALESILAQATDGLEVVVLDGGSTDNTPAVVAAIAERCAAVRYVRQEHRGGIDADLARSVELARGEYCWLLSADDALRPGAVQRILNEFSRGYDVLLCNRVWCDIDLNELATQSWLGEGSLDRDVDLGRKEDIAAYLTSAQSLGALFSFMSCIGFRRQSWISVRGAAIPCYSHVAKLFRMARLRYIAAPLVLCRGGMDSFRAGGLASRLLIDLRGFRELADLLFSADEPARRAFLAVMRREHPLRQWVRARIETPDHRRWEEVRHELRGYGFSAPEILLVDLIGGPLAWLRAAKRAQSSS